MIRGLGLLTTVAMLATAALAASTMQAAPDTPRTGHPPDARRGTRRAASATCATTCISRFPADQARTITGRVAITFALKDASPAARARFRAAAKACAAFERRTRPIPSRDRFPITSSFRRRICSEGRNEIVIEFVAGDAALNRNPEFLYTLFVPARAHLTFPCFDQPDLKARWTLGLEVPAGWQAVANGAETARREADGRVRLAFAETEPLSTYLFAFAAGRFSVETAERGGRTFRMLHRETDAAKVARNRDAVFDLHASALAWLERYTGIPYPWGKFDFLLVPSFQFGGMEHAGAIFYNSAEPAARPVGDAESETRPRQPHRPRDRPHVVRRSRDDAVVQRRVDEGGLRELHGGEDRQPVVPRDQSRPALPARALSVRVRDRSHAGHQCDPPAARQPQRGRLALRRDHLSEGADRHAAARGHPRARTPFATDCRSTCARHRFANATWPDLITLLDARTPEDLAAWSRAWVEEAGRPIVATELAVDNGRIASLAFVQRDPVARRGLVWNQRLQVTLGLPDGLRTLPVRIARRTVRRARRARTPGAAFRAALGRRHRLRRVRARRGQPELPGRPPARDRRSSRRAARPGSRSGNRCSSAGRPRRASSISRSRALPRETDEQNVQRILGYAQAGVLDLPSSTGPRPCRAAPRDRC